jgi:hypothetical protein
MVMYDALLMCHNQYKLKQLDKKKKNVYQSLVKVAADDILLFIDSKVSYLLSPGFFKSVRHLFVLRF